MWRRLGLTMAFSATVSKVAGGSMELQFPFTENFPPKASRNFLPPICCAPLKQQASFRLKDLRNVFIKYILKSLFTWATLVDSGIMCELCSGRGWLICDFCKGQKANVKSDTNRVYRRCPSCRAVGCILCSKCKVFKCVTFPDQNDGMELVL